MSNALHDYAKLFEKYAANNGGTGAILAGEDCLALANEMRMDADDLERENANLRSQCADLVDERERLFQANVEKNGEVLRLVNENAKLRELVDYMTPIALYGASEQERDRMRELGAEVDS